MLAVIFPDADFIGVLKSDKAVPAAGIVSQSDRFLLGSAVVSEKHASLVAKVWMIQIIEKISWHAG